jgi:hypothetical protein
LLLTFSEIRVNRALIKAYASAKAPYVADIDELTR